MKRKNIILWVTGLAVLTFIVFWLGWDDVSASLQQVNLGIFSLLLLLQVLTLLAAAWQWQFLLVRANQKLSFFKVFAITLAGNYIESVTPAVKLGGEAAKIYLFRQFTTLASDYLTGILLALKYFSILPFFCLVFIFSGFALIIFNMPLFAFAAFGFLLLFFTALTLIYWKAGSSRRKSHDQIIPGKHNVETETIGVENLFVAFMLKLKKRLDQMITFINRSAVFARGMTTGLESIALISISTLVWVIYPVKVLLVTRMLGLDISIFSVAVITFTAYLISMVPLLPGGLGSYEATMTLMFSLYGFSPAEGITVALLTRLVTYWFPLLLSAFATAFLALSRPGGISLPGNSRRAPCLSSRIESSSLGVKYKAT